MSISPSLDDLAAATMEEIARAAAHDAPPPVERWHPGHCGHSAMRIARDGAWYHEGRPIRRPELVRLFSRILRREPDGRHVLVTPAEMLEIDVEDAPFVAGEMKTEGKGAGRTIAFRLNTGDPLVAGPDHPIRVAMMPAGPRPTVLVRGGLEALIARPIYYELAEIAIAEGADPPGLWSDGAFFRLDGGP